MDEKIQSCFRTRKDICFRNARSKTSLKQRCLSHKCGSSKIGKMHVKCESKTCVKMAMNTAHINAQKKNNEQTHNVHMKNRLNGHIYRWAVRHSERLRHSPWRLRGSPGKMPCSTSLLPLPFAGLHTDRQESATLLPVRRSRVDASSTPKFSAVKRREFTFTASKIFTRNLARV